MRGWPPARRPRLLMLAALLGLALNLRTAVSSLGVLLPQIRTGLGMSTSFAGLLTTVPVLCFAGFGLIANALVARLGLHRTVALALAVGTAGMLARPLVGDRWLFLVLTTAALAGVALGNVALPALTKRHFPDRIARVSSLYGAVLVGGAALAAAVTVPMSTLLDGWPLLDGWRGGLLLWGVVAGVVLVPWIGLAIPDRVHPDTPRGWRLRRVARSPMAWLMGLLFGSQAAQAYAQFGWYPEMLIDRGVATATAAVMLGVLSAVSLPLTLALPWFMRWLPGARLPIAYAVVTGLGWVAVLALPGAPLVSALLLGAGSTSFTWVLALIGQRSRTPEGTVALSGFVQGSGYLLAALGPLGAGVLRDLSGSWEVPILVLACLAALIGVFGVAVARPRTVEDDLDRRAALASRFAHGRAFRDR